MDESTVKRKLDKIRSQFLKYDHECKKLTDLNSYMTSEGSNFTEEEIFVR